MLLSDITSRIQTGCRAVGLTVPGVDDIEKLILQGLQILANQEQYTGRQAQFQKQFSTLPVINGLVDLSALFDLLIDHIDGSSIIYTNGSDSSTSTVDLLPSSASQAHLMTPKYLPGLFAARVGNGLMVYDESGQAAQDGVLDLVAGFVESLANLIEAFSDNLISIVIGLVAGTESKDEQTATA